MKDNINLGQNLYRKRSLLKENIASTKDLFEWHKNHTPLTEIEEQRIIILDSHLGWWLSELDENYELLKERMKAREKETKFT